MTRVTSARCLARGRQCHYYLRLSSHVWPIDIHAAIIMRPMKIISRHVENVG